MTAQITDPHIGLIVEGKGDEVAVPHLLRNHMHMRGDYRDVLTKPIKTNGVSNALKPRGIEGYVATAASRPGCRGILVVLDADDQCPVERAGLLRARIDAVSHIPVELALAVKNYEDWLYASIDTLQLEVTEYQAGKNGKAEIQAGMTEKYVKPVWQPRLTARLDLGLARTRSASLDRLLSRFDELVQLVP